MNIATIPIHIFTSVFLQFNLIILNLIRIVIKKIAYTYPSISHLRCGNQNEIQLHLHHQQGSFPENNNDTLVLDLRNI